VIAGIDFSTFAVDVVLLDEDSDAATWHRAALDGQDAFDRARDVRRAMRDLSHIWDDVLACGIEQTQMRGSGMASAYSLYRVQGAVLACIPPMMLVQPLIPAAWRKTVGLKGNATKLDVAEWVIHNAPLEIADKWPQDAMDAYCIALATRTLLHTSEQAA
jgi:Holliday junction resolvasome RuvABC endonuclease subunit